ncbi:MAG: hypothetical protein ABIG69_18255 [Bacteroidota bacterium]|nr:hypothetical protein [Bacteroidota bacterium]
MSRGKFIKWKVYQVIKLIKNARLERWIVIDVNMIRFEDDAVICGRIDLNRKR